MKKIWLLLFIFVIACNKAEKTPSHAPVSEPTTDECILVAEISDPKQPNDHPLSICMYTHTETRGIYAATACVAVLIEGQSGVRHPFYGSKGHWGIEGNCEANAISKKMKDPETMKTVNPISDLKMKRKQGRAVKIFVDKFGLGETLLAVTKP